MFAGHPRSSRPCCKICSLGRPMPPPCLSLTGQEGRWSSKLLHVASPDDQKKAEATGLESRGIGALREKGICVLVLWQLVAARAESGSRDGVDVICSWAVRADCSRRFETLDTDSSAALSRAEMHVVSGNELKLFDFRRQGQCRCQGCSDRDPGDVALMLGSAHTTPASCVKCIACKKSKGGVLRGLSPGHLTTLTLEMTEAGSCRGLLAAVC